ncbi:interleukin-17 receptor D [Polymixia lowei]
MNDSFFPPAFLRTNSCEVLLGSDNLVCKPFWKPRFLNVSQLGSNVHVMFDSAPSSFGFSLYFLYYKLRQDGPFRLQRCQPELNLPRTTCVLQDVGPGTYTIQLRDDSNMTRRQTQYHVSQVHSPWAGPIRAMAITVPLVIMSAFATLFTVMCRKKQQENIYSQLDEESSESSSHSAVLSPERPWPRPKVFVCYSSRDCPKHTAVIQSFAYFLQDFCGCEVILDLWEHLEMCREGQMSWLSRQLDEANYIITVCSKGLRYYAEKKSRRGKTPVSRRGNSSSSPIGGSGSDLFIAGVAMIAEKLRLAQQSEGGGAQELSRYMTVYFDYSTEKDVPTMLSLAPRFRLMEQLPQLFSRLHSNQSSLMDRGPRLHSNQSSLMDQEPRLHSNQSSLMDQEPRLHSNQSSLMDRGPRLHSNQSSLMDQEPRLHSNQSSLMDRGPRLHSNQSSLMDQEPRLHSNQSSLMDRGPRLHSNQSSLMDRGPRLHSNQSSLMDRGPRLHSNQSSLMDREPQPQNLSKRNYFRSKSGRSLYVAICNMHQYISHNPDWFLTQLDPSSSSPSSSSVPAQGDPPQPSCSSSSPHRERLDSGLVLNEVLLKTSSLEGGDRLKRNMLLLAPGSGPSLSLAPSPSLSLAPSPSPSLAPSPSPSLPHCSLSGPPSTSRSGCGISGLVHGESSSSAPSILQEVVCPSPALPPQAIEAPPSPPEIPPPRDSGIYDSSVPSSELSIPLMEGLSHDQADSSSLADSESSSSGLGDEEPPAVGSLHCTVATVCKAQLHHHRPLEHSDGLTPVAPL